MNSRFIHTVIIAFVVSFIQVTVLDASDVQDPPLTVGAHWPMPVMDDQLFTSLIVDQLEYRADRNSGSIRWDITGWFGGDYNRIWIKTEGDLKTSDGEGERSENQLLYGRLIAPYWDFQVGLRHDQEWKSPDTQSRTFLVLGLQGLAPYEYEMEPALFVSERGDISARVTVKADFLITQQLILQPRIDIEAAAQEVESFRIGRGINNFELGLRLRYEVVREVAPYIGVDWKRLVGDTALLARQSNEDADIFNVVAGVRLWF